MAKVLGFHALKNAASRAYAASKEKLRPLLLPAGVAAGTLTMLAGLAAAGAGLAKASEVTIGNIGERVAAHLVDADTPPLQRMHSTAEAGLGVGGFALFIASGTVTARSLRRRRGAEPGPAANQAIQPIYEGGQVVDIDFSAGALDFYILDQALERGNKSTRMDRLEARWAARREARAAERAEFSAVIAAERAERQTANNEARALANTHYDGFATHMVPAAPDLNQLAGLSLD
jgi:hypothetical protein